MNHKVKRFHLIGLLVLCLVLLGPSAYASDWVIEINNGDTELEPVDAEPYLNEDGRTMVPLRFISESFGADVEWLPATQQVIIRLKTTTVDFQVNSDLFRVNGKTRQMDTEMILDPETGRTFVPLRFALEPLGVAIEHVEFLSTGVLQIDLDQSDNIFNIRIGTDSQDLVRQLGQPQAVGLSAYGYEWWIYSDDYDQYLQVGVDDNQVVALYSNSPYFTYMNTHVSMDYGSFRETIAIEDIVKTTYDHVALGIQQPGHGERYLLVEGDTAIEWFIDLEDHAISSIRVTKLPYILTQRTYDFTYSFVGGSKPDYSAPTLTPDQQVQVDDTNSLVLFHLNNIARKKRGLSVLVLDERISDLALSHSKDMFIHDFFDHKSPNTGSLGDRFATWNISYRSISENIAFGQADGVYAHEGLMNSPGHRTNILSPGPSHIGTGSYHRYYTINFKE